MKHFYALSALCTLLSTMLALASFASSTEAMQPTDSYAYGVALYNQKNFQGAVQVFENFIAKDTQNVNALYFCALANQQSGNLKRANQLFEHITKYFPNTTAAQYAATGLKNLNMNEMSTTTAMGSSVPAAADNSGTKDAHNSGRSNLSSNPSDFDSLPAQSKVYFERRGLHIWVPVEINGRTVSMMFDTGAPDICLSIQMLESLGIQTPSGRQEGLVGGIGGKHFSAWQLPLNVRVGEINRANISATAVDNPDEEPLLGQAFFAPFDYTIDDNAQTIFFRKKGSSMASESANRMKNVGDTVPFKWEGGRVGGHMIVEGEINGKYTPMIFDTGAYSIVLTPKDMKRLNMTIPEGAIYGRSGGAGGMTGDYQFEVDSIKVGNIHKQDIEVHVVEESALNMPLLGQPFFTDYEYSIDQEKMLIRFVKK